MIYSIPAPNARVDAASAHAGHALPWLSKPFALRPPVHYAARPSPALSLARVCLPLSPACLDAAWVGCECEKPV